MSALAQTKSNPKCRARYYIGQTNHVAFQKHQVGLKAAQGDYKCTPSDLPVYNRL